MEEKKDKKKIFVIASIVAILVIAIGATYAFYTYSNTGLESKLIAGEMYMKYVEGSALNINGAMPSSTYPTSSSGNYFQFQITGKNTHTTKDITYNLKLAYGDVPNGKSESNRIDDEYLLFKLVEVNGNSETAVVTDAIFDTIPGALLYSTTVPHDTTNVITKTYRLYARISEEVGIGNGTGAIYSISDWNNLFATIMINAEGSLSDATPVVPIATPANCFSTSENGDGTLTITGYNGSCGGNVVIPSQIDVSVNPSQSSSKNNNDNNISYMPNKIENNNIVRKTDNNNLKTVTAIGTSAFKCYDGLCGSFEGSTIAGDYGESSSETYSSSGSISNSSLDSIVNTLVIPNTVVSIGNSAFYKNSITTLVIPNSVERISMLAFYGNQISDLTLGNNVETIGVDAFKGSVIDELILPDSLVSIETGAFCDAQIEELVIPDSVETIGKFAFNNNPLQHLTLGSGLTSIDEYAFASSSLDSVTFRSFPNIESYAFYDLHPNRVIFDVSSIDENFSSYILSCPVNTDLIVISDNVESIAEDAFDEIDYNYDIVFNKSCTQVEQMENYPWGFNGTYNKLYGNNVECNID